MKHFTILVTIIILITIVYIGRISYFQLFTDRYRLNAQNTSIKFEYDIPLRGQIMDRNGKLLAGNIFLYQLCYKESMMNNKFDTIEFCNLVGINKQDFIKKIVSLNTKSLYKKNFPQIFLDLLTIDDISKIQEKIHRFPAFTITKKITRSYQVSGAGNIIGYINKINNLYLKKDPRYYLPGDLVGMAGIERFYEKILRGIRGIHYYKKNIYQQIIGPYEDGKFDVESQNGKDIILTIDYDLQEYAEELLKGKFGAAVAINPNNGEILCLATAPTINPRTLIGKHKKKTLYRLLNDKFGTPMYDRSTQASYPPGSTFKLLNALVGQQLQVITDKTTFFCFHGIKLGKKFVKCHDSGKVRLVSSIASSCNSYYCKLYIKMLELYPHDIQKNLNIWNDYIMSFGLNQFFGNDVFSGSKGNIPNSQFYNNLYKNKKWNAYSIFSNGIGQGEILITPLQMANFTASIANQGFYYTPHIVKYIDGKMNHYFIEKKKLK